MKILCETRILALLFVPFLLTGCGGGGGGSDDELLIVPSPTPSVAPLPSDAPSPPTSEPTPSPSVVPSPSPTLPPTPAPSPTTEPPSNTTQIERITTTLGDNFAVSGDATILLADGNIRLTSDLDGYTLYTLATDGTDTGVSACEGNCIDTWPPLIATDDDEAESPFNILERRDGHRQWALRGKPLYFFNNDIGPGDVSGHGAGGVWFAASGAPISNGKINDGQNDFDTLVGGAGKVTIHNGLDSARINKEGFAIYTYVNDIPGEPSVCNEGCLVNWPALIADAKDIAIAPFSLIEHPNENVGLQWAYHGKPLYFRTQDTTPGIATNNPAWPLATPIPFQGIPGLTVTGVGETLQATLENGQEIIRPQPSHGMTLYTFANDTPGQPSTCTSASCMDAWRALMAGDGAKEIGAFNLIGRVGGGYQWALDGMPLYYRAADSLPGENNENANWPAARIAPARISDGHLVTSSYDLSGEDDFAGRTLYFRSEDSQTGTVSLQDLRESVFDPHCGSCHDATALGGLVLTETTSEEIHAELLSISAAPDATGVSANLNLVEPHQPDKSYIMHKLLDEPGIAGSRMPSFNQEPLEDALIAMVAEWILYGAPLEGTGTPSPCVGACLAVYPPYLAEVGAIAHGEFSIITNANGQRQWAYEGNPLYFFVGDEEPGERNASDSWPLATPSDNNQEPSPGPDPEAAPLRKAITLLNDVVVASGEVTILQSDGSTSTRSDLNGHTLYTLATDTPNTGVSDCSEACIDTWPPLLASENDVNERPFTIVVREDGHRQWALRDKPLYFFSNDAAPGDILGHGVGGNWFAASGSPTIVSALTIEQEAVDAIVGGAGRVFVHNGIDSAWRDKEGFALYTFANDTAGEPSNCDKACLANWPALVADQNDLAVPPFSLVEHPEESVGLQWAYRGMPLYFRNDDEFPGGAVNNPVWPLAKPIPFQGEAGTVLSGVGEVLQATLVEGEEVILLTPKHGMTLYTFANDEAGQSSTCISENCLNAWPALMAAAGAEAFGPFSLIERVAGGSQWALNGWPLYFRAADTSPGDNNESEIWPAARITPANNIEGRLVANGTQVDGGEFEGRTLYFRAADAATGTVSLDRVIDEVFTPYCGGCHGALGGITLTAVDKAVIYENLLTTTPALVGVNRVEPYEPEDSYLIHKMRGGDTIPGTVMPPNGALSDDLIELAEEWIAFGAPIEGNGVAAPCDSECLSAWPAYLASEGAVATGLYSIITNAIGQRQWAYQGKPLYFFSGDTAPGDENISQSWPGAIAAEPVSEPSPTPEPSAEPSPSPEPSAEPSPEPSPEPAPIEAAQSLLGQIYVATEKVTVLLANGESVIRTDLEGYTLYTLSTEVPESGTTTCVDDCLNTWLPLLAGPLDSNEAPLTIIERQDGHRQWGLRGKPLYLFAGDTVPGDISGHGINDEWYAASAAPTSQAALVIDDNLIDVLVGGAGELLSHNGTNSNRINKEGFTLYTYSNDSFGQPSTCDGGCLAEWPALLAEEGDVAIEPFSVIEHPNEDIGLQWAYRGMPLYFRTEDAAPGDAADDPSWPLVRPIPFQGQAGTVLTAVNEVLQATIVDENEVINPVPSEGLTLYTFTNDSAGSASTCITEDCLNAWPALIAHKGAAAFGPFSIIERLDGGSQWALEGMPLYFRAADETPGENNENATWPAARISPANPEGGTLTAYGPEVDGGFAFAGRAIYFRAADSKTGTVSLQELREAVFTPHCSSCHGTSGELKLDNASNEEIYDALLSPAIAEGTTGASVGLNRVEPYEPDSSYLIHTLQDEPGIGGFLGRMPALTLDPLASDLIEMVREWIDNGAPLEGTGSEEPPCDEPCLIAWPPYLASPDAIPFGSYGIVINSKDERQWTYNDKPLYFFNGDSTPEDNNASETWPLATP